MAHGQFSGAMPDDELLEATRGVVAKVAVGATGAFTASKELIAHIRDQRLGLWESMEEENAEQARLCRTDDSCRGLQGLLGEENPGV